MTLKVTESRRLLASLALGLGISTAWAQDAGRFEPLDSIRGAAEKFVRSQLPQDSTVASVTAGTLDGRLRLARCTEGLHTQLPSGATLQSHVLVGVGCQGPVHWSVYVSVTVESRISVLVLKHPVPRDARLTADDVTVEPRKVTDQTTAYLTAVSDLQGRSAQRPLSMGTPLTMDMLKADLVIQHGQEVTLVAAAGGIEVRATGRALADGATGTRIKVQNLSSMKVVEGVVDGPDLVRVSE
jgi:flagellar basal body P-ring formation protein FlgA